MDDFHQQLLDTSTYPEATASVSFKETHISRIYLTDTRVYKFKKPLDLGFLDYSTLAKRHHFCQEEIRLNQRFTSDVYLGVVALRLHNGKIGFGQKGAIQDFAVRMRRLPENLMLDRLIEARADNLEDEMPRLGLAIQTAMEQAEICLNEPVSYVKRVMRNCEENFSQTTAAIGSSLTEDAHRFMLKITRRDLDAFAEIMRSREARGMVRDGHGDLHSANICLTDPICIYDCIEFNRRFRVADMLDELAFLVMDLDFRGRRDLAGKLTAGYQELLHGREFKSLLSFYKGYRAWIRGKVEAILATDQNATKETRDNAATLARQHFNLALGYRIKPTLFITSGLMGVGKTTLSASLAQATGAEHLRSDVIRKQLAGLPEAQHLHEDFGAGLYTQKMSERTYNELFRATEVAMSRQQIIVVDASFAQEVDRNKFLGLAEQTGYPAWLMHLTCPDKLTLQRLDQRVGDASDGRRELFAQHKVLFNQITATNRMVTVDTSCPVDYNVQSLLCSALADQEQLS
jgi:aminoglycoside phosphotransferase family enzyme/predicted kinase